MTTKKLTIKELVTEGCCPFCGAEGVEYGDWESDEGEVYQEGSCSECEKTWQEVYLLKFIFVKPTEDSNTWYSVDVGVLSKIDKEEKPA